MIDEWFQIHVVGSVRELQKLVSHQRSKTWRKTRKAFLAENPCCAVCGKKGKGINVHHIVPFHIAPELEEVPSNLITMCRKHHFLFGHLNLWKSWNETVVEDCFRWREKLTNRPTKK